jgi:hypothetical protein
MRGKIHGDYRKIFLLPGQPLSKHARYTADMNNMNPQLELSFAGQTQPYRLSRRQTRLSQARWWFDRMRQVVDRALDRGQGNPGRPEQIYFVLRRGA